MLAFPILAKLDSSPWFRRGLVVLGLVAAVVAWFYIVTASPTGWDAHAYWAAPLNDPYAHSTAGTPDAYLYSPAFRQAVAPLTALPWAAFAAAWEALLLATVIALAGPLTALVLAVPFVLYDLRAGNIEVLLAAAIVLGFRYPAAWCFVLLTKVTPGVGLVWFAVRREWRNLAIALAATLVVGAASFALAPGLWPQWWKVLLTNAQAAPDPGSLESPRIWARALIGLVVVAAGARTNKRWTVIVGATLSMPILYLVNAVVLVGLVPLLTPDAHAWFGFPGHGDRPPGPPAGFYRDSPRPQSR
jgi:Glycosyltransferase family 87